VSHRIEFALAAVRQFSKLPRDAQRRIAPHVDALAEQPRPESAKRLVANEELWRIRVGSYRVVYAVEDDHLLVLVVNLGHRRR